MGGEGLTLGMQMSGCSMSNLFVPRPVRVGCCGRATAAGRRPQRATMLWLVGCAMVPLFAGGCALGDGLSRVVEVTPGRFNSVVLQSEQPVLVNFYKPG